MKKELLLIVLLFLANLTVKSQGLKGNNLGEIASRKIIHSTYVEGIVGDLEISTLEDGRIWRLFFISDFNVRFTDIDSEDFKQFRKGLNSEFNISLKEYDQSVSVKTAEGELLYREFRDNKTGVEYLLQFGNLNDKSFGNEIYFWIIDIELEKINKIENSNTN